MLISIKFGRELANSQNKGKIQGYNNYFIWELESNNALVEEKNQHYFINVGTGSDRKTPQFKIEIQENYIEITPELFGLSPLFYYSNDNFVCLASEINLLKNKLEVSLKLSINKRFIVEQNLFNYSLFDSTLYKDIHLVPANCKVIIKDRVIIQQLLNIEDYFCDNPLSIKKSIHSITDQFIDISKSKIRSGDYISFTGGFDGRSLLSLALFFDKQIQTYSFGSAVNPDVLLPQKQALILNVPFLPITLDNEQYYSYYIRDGLNDLLSASANSNLMQIHWFYASTILAKKTDTIVAGFFGSEIFRSAHIAGQFTSPNLISYFKNFEDNSWIQDLRNSTTLNFLPIGNYSKELESIIEDLMLYKEKIKSLSENQRFYKYIFDESFRKFFGLQFIQAMRRNVNVISPFLDIDFLKSIFKTELAGINNDFFTHNPFKRFKGQLFYAELMRKTNPTLYSLQTSKGYSPMDLQSVQGKMNIFYNYYANHLRKKVIKTDLDNLGIISAFSKLLIIKQPIKINEEFYNKHFINQLLLSREWKNNNLLRDKFIETLSTNYLITSLTDDHV